MNIYRNIIPVSAFKRSTQQYIYGLEVFEGPILLTVHGRGAVVVEHMKSYERMLEMSLIRNQTEIEPAFPHQQAKV